MIRKDVVEYLTELKLGQLPGTQVYYFSNNGNAGDALINMGFYAIAEKIALDYSPICCHSAEQIKRGDIIIIGGGGTIVPEWPSTGNFIRHIIEKECKIVILPQSIREADDLLLQLAQGSVIFCRERYSYAYCNSLSLQAAVYFDHDIALHANIEVISKLTQNKMNLTFKNIVRQMLCWYHVIRARFTKKIYAMRVDKEARSSLKCRRSRYNDISLVAAFGASSYEDSIYSAHKLLKLISCYEIIHTDRLHVSLAGCLLGKQVYMYSNNYYKCKGVYEATLKHYANISLLE